MSPSITTANLHRSRRPQRLRRASAVRGLGELMFVVWALATACASEPAPRASASPRAQDPGPTATAGQADSVSAEARDGVAAPVAIDPDTIAPLAPLGVPAGDFPEPDRPVARITTDTWSNEEARDEAREASRTIELLGVREGMAVADIGAGSGYHTVRLARAVGPSGRVYAEDIMRSYLEKLRERVKREGLSNVALVLGDPHDPRLPEASLDVALLVHMYHEVEQPYGLLYNLAPALKPGARVAVIDLDRATARHGTPLELLRCELGAVGYSHVATHDLGKSGYLAIFEPPAGRAALPVPEAITACAA